MSDNEHVARPSAWEAVAIGKIRAKVTAMAKGIQGLHHIGWTPEDATSEMLIAAVQACRRWAEDKNTEPEPRYLMTAIVRRRYRIWERVRKGYERETLNRVALQSESGEERLLESCLIEMPEQPDQAVEQGIVADNCASVVYKLRQSLDPQDFAMLQLRTMDFKPRKIAEVMGLDRDGVPDHQEVSRRLYRIRKKAAEFLRQVGIHTFEDATEANQRNLFNAEQQHAS